MNIHVLVENNEGIGYESEHGLSLFLEIGELKILFDTGQSALFIKNAVKMGIDVNKAHFVVLSHGHYDHGNGLSYLINKELVCHIGSFVKRFRNRDGSEIGLPLTLKEAQERFILRMSDAPTELYKDVFFMGGIPRKYDFESSKLFSYLESGQGDSILDDSALVVKSEKGNIIISGCSHSGICNIVDHAISITGDVRTYAIIGGLHLKHKDLQLEETIKYLNAIGVKKIYPIHCTDKLVVDHMKEKMLGTSVMTVRTGDAFTIVTK